MLRVPIRRLITHPLFRLLAVVSMMALSVPVGSYGLKTLHRPGPVSDTASAGTMLNGYASHAEFEKECSHCHAPLHCITANRCQECHLDIAKQRQDAIGLHGVLPGTARCQTCHIEHRGRDAVISEVPLANIDHGELTGFSVALHVQNLGDDALVCDDCHIDHQFAPESVDCLNCHGNNEPEFIAQHQVDYGQRCLDCHDGRDRMLAFEHDAYYPLSGGHATVACVDCHQDHVYVGNSDECADCHNEPDLHAGKFGLHCERCHTAAAWAPAQFRQHTFLAALGPEGDLDCQVCHVESYTQYPCDSCHTRGEMRAVHRPLDISAIDDCIGCHPTGPGRVRAAPGREEPLRLEAQPEARVDDSSGIIWDARFGAVQSPAANRGVDSGQSRNPAQHSDRGGSHGPGG